MGRAYSGPKRDHPGRLSYHGTARRRTSFYWLAPAPLLVLVVASFLGGCSMQLSSLLPGGVSDQGPVPQGPSVVQQTSTDNITTGSIPLRMTSADVPAGMPATDWPYAKVALKEALSRTVDGPSIAWSNPATGAQGTVMPMASAFERDGFPCRNFLASHVVSGVETWSEGTACRVHRGEWEVKSIKAVKKT